MTIPNPLVITVNAVAKNLPRINNDNYTSEYLFADTTEEYRVKIRHSKENVQANGVQLDRHNVELTHTIYGTGGDPDTVVQTYTVIRHGKASTATQMGYIQSALNGLLTAGFVSDLRGWQS
ncbi:MAG: putative coat protein [Gulmivirus nemorisadaptatum]|uniref:Coat protein n=1 Tax=Leviviridae sp. TaxID=2027243 RepID=A0ABY3STF6_9VIRU|nr:MAG: putative coat protein [Leviviridae sp.]